MLSSRKIWNIGEKLYTENHHIHYITQNKKISWIFNRWIGKKVIVSTTEING